MSEITEIRCQGWYNNRPCNSLLFKGNIEEGYINIKCDKCKNIVHVGKGIVFTKIIKKQLDVNAQYIINL